MHTPQLSEADISKIKQFFIPEQGYATPKVDLRACIVQEEKVLLVKERADGKWTLPGGCWARTVKKVPLSFGPKVLPPN